MNQGRAVVEILSNREQVAADEGERAESKTKGKVLKIWCLAPDQLDHIRPVEKAFGPEAEFIYDPDCDPVRMIEGKPDIAVCVNEFPLAIADCLAEAHRQGVPTLLLQDGILEWRCQYENPLFGYGSGPPQHQPVLADKIACLGEESARVIGSWGNDEKVEVTGMPRLDHLLSRSRVARKSPGKRILIGAAKNPGFTAEQRQITLGSLVDVAAELKRRPDLDVIWRVPPGVAQQLGVPNQLSAFSSQDFASTLEQADAFITTPSTSMLEAMMLDRPVAALDYHNVPRFVSTAWTISAREHIASVIDDLLRCPANKMQYQSLLLQDCLACRAPAAFRVAELISKMVKTSRGTDGARRTFPARLLGREWFGARPEQPDLADLYPQQELFKVTDVQRLQIDVARLRKANEGLQRQLRERSLSDALRTVARRLWRARGREG